MVLLSDVIITQTFPAACLKIVMYGYDLKSNTGGRSIIKVTEKNII